MEVLAAQTIQNVNRCNANTHIHTPITPLTKNAHIVKATPTQHIISAKASLALPITNYSPIIYLHNLKNGLIMLNLRSHCLSLLNNSVKASYPCNCLMRILTNGLRMPSK